MPMRSRQCWRSRRSRFRTAPARAEGPVEGLLSVAKLPMKSDGEAPSEPGAAACSAKSGPTMLTRVLSVVPSRPGEFHPEPLTGRVEDWRACLGRCSCCLLSRPFVCECHNISTVLRFQPPPRRTQRADFPHCALLFASPQGLWGLSCWGDFRHAPSNLVAVVQPQRFVQPLRTPPLPTEAVPVPGPRHMAPDLVNKRPRLTPSPLNRSMA
jgi:hypothetical protein